MISLVALENLVKENEERVNIQKRQLSEHESGETRMSRVALASTESNLEKATEDLTKYNAMLAELLEQDRAEIEEKERLEAAIQRKKYFENQHIRIQDNTELPSDQKIEAMHIIDELPSEVFFEDDDLFKVAATSIELNIRNHNDLAEQLTTIDKEFKAMIKVVKDKEVSDLGMLNFQIPIIVLHFSVLLANIKEVLEEKRDARIQRAQKQVTAEHALEESKKAAEKARVALEKSQNKKKDENPDSSEENGEETQEDEGESAEEKAEREASEKKLEEILKAIEIKEKQQTLFRGFPKYEDWWVHEMWGSHQAYFALYKWKAIINDLCQNAKENIEWLDEIAVPFSRDENNNIAQRQMGGASNKRACYSSDYTGLKLIHTLYDNCLKEKIEFLNEYLLLNIIKEENTAVGITVLNIVTGETQEIFAKQIILASGGYGGLYYGHTTNSFATTGEVINIAYNAGCELSNMEFVQFHPTTLIKSNILVSESARGEGGYLVTKDGVRFVDELRPRDEVARAIYKKLQNKEEVYLDLRHLGIEKINEAMPQERRLAYEFLNIKIEEELLPINPAAHYTMGGIKTNQHAITSVKNLYACGECAEHGVHGANRLGGNSLLEIVSFGKIAGLHAAKSAANTTPNNSKTSTQLEIDKKQIVDLYEYSNEINFYDIKHELGKLLFEKVGLFRNEEDLSFALEKVELWQNQYENMGLGDKSKQYNKNLVEFIEFKHMLELSNIIINCALNRKESRGAHFRTDYPKEDTRYAKRTVALGQNDGLQMNFEETV